MSSRARVRSAAVLALIGMAAGATAVAIATAVDDSGCEQAAARIDAVEDRLHGIQRATAAADPPWAEHAATRVRAAIEAYASTWRAAWLDACAAGRAAGELPRASALDLRRQCLDDRLVDVDAVSSALAVGVDPDRAVRAADGLPRLGDCSNPAHLSSRTPLPADPTTRRAIEIVRRELIAQQFEPDPIEAAVATSDLVDEAADLDYAPLHIEALRVFGMRQLEAGKLAAGLHNLEQSVLLAREHADHEAAFTGLLALAAADGRAAAMRWLADAETLLPGVSTAHEREAQLRLLQGTLQASAGHRDAARTALARAVALFEGDLESIGRAHLLLADLTEGEASQHHRELARNAWLTLYGPDHPRVEGL